MTIWPSSLTTSLNAFVLALVVGLASPARAGLEVQVSPTGAAGSWTTLLSSGSGTSASFTGPAEVGNTDIYVLALSASSSSPRSFLSGSGLLENQSLTQTETVYLTLGDIAFRNPTAPPGQAGLETVATGSVIPIPQPPRSSTIVYQSFVDPGNRQNYTGAGSLSTPLQTFVTTSGYSGSQTAPPVTHLTGPYSITEFFQITISPLSFVSFSPTTTVVAIPEPSSMAIAALGMLGMIGYGVRRRRIV